MDAAPPAPHPNCNWLIPGRLLVGSRPDKETLPAILSVADVIANLENVPESTWYVQPELGFFANDGDRPGRAYRTLPISAGDVPAVQPCRWFLDAVRDDILRGRVVYLHCTTGCGRSGMIGAILYGFLMGARACEAIAAVEVSALIPFPSDCAFALTRARSPLRTAGGPEHANGAGERGRANPGDGGAGVLRRPVAGRRARHPAPRPA